MPAETLKILIVTDITADAMQLVRLLEDHFEHLETSSIESRFIADFERVRPDVLVLAFPSLERAERYSLGLYRHCEIAHTLSHRSIVLCDKDHVHRAFELCKKEYFDDYVMYWPMVYDTPRLAMSILIAGRSLSAQRAAPRAREVAAHARSVGQLEAVLDESLTVGRQHTEALGDALRYADAGTQTLLTPNAYAPTTSAKPPHAPTTLASGAPLPAETLTPAHSPLAASTFDLPRGEPEFLDLDLDGVPSGLSQHPPGSTRQRDDVIREVQVRIDDAQKKVVPLTEWIGGLKKDVQPQLDAARQLGELAKQSPPLVLVVDDDQFQCKLLERMLGNAGYRAVVAHSGAEALALLRRQQPDMILMDVALPDLNGVEITRRLKSSPRTAATPIVMITGHSERQVLQASLKAGAVDFLVKPFDREVLLNKIARHLVR